MYLRENFKLVCESGEHIVKPQDLDDSYKSKLYLKLSGSEVLSWVQGSYVALAPVSYDAPVREWWQGPRSGTDNLQALFSYE